MTLEVGILIWVTNWKCFNSIYVSRLFEKDIQLSLGRELEWINKSLSTINKVISYVCSMMFDEWILKMLYEYRVWPTCMNNNINRMTHLKYYGALIVKSLPFSSITTTTTTTTCTYLPLYEGWTIWLYGGTSPPISPSVSVLRSRPGNHGNSPELVHFQFFRL